MRLMEKILQKIVQYSAYEFDIPECINALKAFNLVLNDLTQGD